MAEVISIHSVEDWKKYIEENTSDKLIVVDFTASWCGPCRFMAPTFAELAKEKPHIIFLKVDVDELKTLAEEWGIRAMPTFLFFKEGKEVDRLVGANKVELQKITTKHGESSSVSA